MKELSTINKNLKYLRKVNDLTQDKFAELLNIKRSSIGAYEEGRAKPNNDILVQLAKQYGISIDDLMTKDLASEAVHSFSNRNVSSRIKGSKMRVLAVSVDERDQKENIELVPTKARAGYLEGYADPEYIQDLPKFRLPFMSPGTYRAFEIDGDSMMPLAPGSVVIGEYITNWYNIKSGDTYVLVSREDGIVYKRITNYINKNGTLLLCSDNLNYPVYSIDVDEVVEVWRAKAFISKDVSDPRISIDSVSQMVLNLQQEVALLRTQIEQNKKNNALDIN